MHPLRNLISSCSAFNCVIISEIMIKNVHLKELLLGAFLLFVPTASFSYSSDAGPVFFIGEDIVHPQGAVLAVNEINQRSYSGGLGLSGEKQELMLNLTLVNNSNRDLEIDIENDFSLDIGAHHYKPVLKEGSLLSERTVTVFSGVQSRIDLLFRVDIKEKKAPELIFNLNNSEIRVVCDKKLGRIITEGYVSADVEDIARTAKLLIDAGRLTPAKNLCDYVLARDSSDTRFLLLMAKVYSKIEDDEEMAYYLNKIDVTKINGPEEAEEAAKMAISIGYSEVALNILTAFDNAGLLNDSQKALKGRAYYYEGKYKEAENTFLKLFNSGYKDSSAFFAMGNVYNRLNDNNRALYYWERALDDDPEYSEALFNIGVGYLNSGDITRAREYWNRVIRSNPDSETLAAAEEALKGTEY